MINLKKVRIIGLPYLYGKDSLLRSEAPTVLRKSGLYKAFKIAGISYEDEGDIEIGAMSAGKSRLYMKLKYLPEILEISKNLAKAVEMTLSANEIPVVLGGDHSIAIGSLLGISARKNDITVVWIDTHGDFHTSKTTPSGRLHGMALALGLGLDKNFCRLFDPAVNFFDKNKTILFGAHKFDPGERKVIDKNISLIDMTHIVRHGIGRAVEKLVGEIHTENIYISLDLDSVDKQYAPGTDMAIDGALTYRELIYTLERLSEKFNVAGIDVVELAPDMDIEGKTANLAIESITTSLGSRVGVYELYMDEIDSI